MSAFFLAHRRTVFLAAFLLTLGGLVTAWRLPVALFPQIDFPRVIIAIDAGDRAPEQMAAEITRPAEIALRTVPNVSRLRSTTSRGSSEISLFFPWGEDMVAATLATQSAMATLVTDLPLGTRFEVRRSDPSLFPVIGLALTSDRLDPPALRQLAERRLRPMLSTVPGVAGVDILGSAPREFAVEIEPEQLAALGLSVAEVATALSGENSVVGVGRIEDRHRLYLVLVDNSIGTIEDLRRTPIKSSEKTTAGVVTLDQVATIRPATEPVFTRVTSNGRDAVLVNVRQSVGGDTVKIVAAVEARLKSASLPPSVKVTPFYDESELLTGAANAVRDAILIGALLAAVVLFLFLRSWRMMAMTGLVLPAVLAAACLALKLAGLGFNMMTLGGMAAAVGLIIDDVVVMLEHIGRRIHEGAEVTAKSVMAAAQELGKPLAGSTAATIVVFVPLAFISGVSGGFFKALAVTMVSSLAVSLLYARYVVPLWAAHWLDKSDAEAVERAGGMIGGIQKRYAVLLDQVLTIRMIVPVAALILIVAGGLAWRSVESGFMPKMDEGGFILDYKAQSGAALADTDRLLRQVERIVTATPEVASYSRRTGVQLGGGLTEPDEGDFFIRLKSGSRRDIETIMTDVRSKIESQVPGLQIETAQLMEDLIGDLTSVPQPIEIKLFGDDRALLEDSAAKVAAAIEKVGGVVEINDGLRVAGDAIAVRVDPGAAEQAGLDPASIATQIEGLIGGNVATRVRVGDQLISVRVRGPSDVRSRADQISSLSLRTPSGASVPVSAIADISVIAGQKQVTREDLSPFIPVTARLEGRDLGSTMRDVQSTVAKLGIPPQVRIDYGGLYAEQQASFTDLTLVFAAAVLLIALLLTFLFERPDWVVAALITIALSAASVMSGLWLTRTELDISALMGLTMVVGMVSELIIFFMSELDPALPVTDEALAMAGGHRLRPILMSAAIAILALSPLAMGLNRSAGLQQSMATAIIAGLIAAVPLVTLILPGLMKIFAFRQETEFVRNV